MDNYQVKSLKDIKESLPKMNSASVEKALTVLQKYKDGKSNLENRIIENDLWYRQRYYNEKTGEDEKSTAWLFNSLANKHADAMDQCPEAIILPREASDKEAAQTLTKVLPVIFERNGFEKTYSDVWWDKLKSGTGVYGVFWNPKLINGLGDIEIQEVDLLSLYWEPGIKDIQKSPNVFYIKLQDNEWLKSKYPQIAHKLGPSGLQKSKYIHDDHIDTTEKTEVIDWYYKRESGHRTVVHYCKICAGEILYSSENMDEYAERGFYDHGKYPFVFDTLFPIEDSPCGFGFVDIVKYAQKEIDTLDKAILTYSKRATNPRYFINSAGAVNEEEFSNWDNNFVHVNGSNLGDDSLKEIKPPELNSIVLDVRERKIEELKEVSGNRDFSQGATVSGVTAASAIAALQEAGGKLTRDMLKQTYRAFGDVTGLAIEEIRQFYENDRFFRIEKPNGQEEFISFNNNAIKQQEQSVLGTAEKSYRLPIFDFKIKSATKDAFSKIAQNELALQLYSAGLFNPENSATACVTVEMMEFENKHDVLTTIEKNGGLYHIIQALAPLTIKLAAVVDKMMGTNGEITQEVINILNNVPQAGGGGSVNIPDIKADNSLEAQSRRRTNEATKPK